MSKNPLTFNVLSEKKNSGPDKHDEKPYYIIYNLPKLHRLYNVCGQSRIPIIFSHEKIEML